MLGKIEGGRRRGRQKMRGLHSNSLNGHEFEQTLLMKDYQKRQRDQRSNCQHLLDNQKREFQKNIYFCFIDYVKAFDCVDQNKL